MRFWLLLMFVASCYSPSVTPGAPCDPLVGNCPRPLMCVAGVSGFTCQTSGGSDDDAAVDADPDAAIDAAPDAPTDAPAVTHVEYPSVVADCIDRANPNPDHCIQFNGPGELAVDAHDSFTNHPWDGYVRFDLDGVIAGRTVTSVRLRMSTTSDTKADSDHSGVVWQVQMFTRASLAIAVPARLGGAPVAGGQGPVTQNQDVMWPLPTSIVDANGSVYLSIVTPSEDGAHYWNQTGTRPPRLIIDLQ